MHTERTLYEERTPWAGWVRVVLWGAVTAACYPVLAGWDTGLPLLGRLSISAGCLVFAAGIEVLLGGLTVQVKESRLFMHLGRVPLVRRSVAFEDITSLEAVRYRPIRDYGGWGVRGWGARKAWSARGDRAVALTLAGDRLLLIGSDHPRRLEERIVRAMSGG
jgi:hypothetical protein